ncbi:hemerythrin [Geomonas silvestris]|uniref:Hemerythrin n=1 Tax=Geomonas silvestris TaxID=2740184 RepID=A0A6V8MCR1_9BACT|nr:hemerythrin domain-containing protein [Geomonas silvestris]GFO57752.1 hemerythrin [Geomonas silvestris]
MAQQLFDLLKRDHRQVEKWMTQIEDGPENQREELFTTLQDALEKHMQMEEKHFYPQVKKIKELKDLATDAIEEHEQAKNFLSQLEDMDLDDEEWLTTFSEMRQGILHHVQDEEKKVFPGCTQHMDAKILQEIGEKCIQEKERTTTSRSSGAKGKK